MASTTNKKSPSAREGLVVPQTHLSPQRRLRAGSSASHTTSDVTPAVRSAPVPAISAASRPPSSASRPGSSISRTSGSKRGPTPVSSAKIAASRTPTPDLPDLYKEPTTPVAMPKQKKTMQVLGLGTPEVDRWIRAGQEGQRKKRSRFGNGDIEDKAAKTVGFKEDDEESDKDELDHDDEREKERSLTMQISPRRPSVNVSGRSPQSWAASPVPNASQIEGGGPSGSSAHELLKTIVQDVMYDFQRDTKAEMMGLHLDLVRMGRGWKMELRSLMDEYVGDLKDLREENQKLRLENDRLRRGTY
jgi:protein NEDD1